MGRDQSSRNKTTATANFHIRAIYSKTTCLPVSSTSYLNQGCIFVWFVSFVYPFQTSTTNDTKGERENIIHTSFRKHLKEPTTRKLLNNVRLTISNSSQDVSILRPMYMGIDMYYICIFKVENSESNIHLRHQTIGRDIKENITKNKNIACIKSYAVSFFRTRPLHQSQSSQRQRLKSAIAYAIRYEPVESNTNYLRVHKFINCFRIWFNLFTLYSSNV